MRKQHEWKVTVTYPEKLLEQFRKNVTSELSVVSEHVREKLLPDGNDFTLLHQLAQSNGGRKLPKPSPYNNDEHHKPVVGRNTESYVFTKVLGMESFVNIVSQAFSERSGSASLILKLVVQCEDEVVGKGYSIMAETRIEGTIGEARPEDW